MIKKLTILGFLALSTPIFAQSNDSFDKLADITCECLKDKNLDAMSKEEATMEMGLCMIGGIAQLPKKEQEKFSFTDEAQMSKMGEKVGLRMAVRCPLTIMAIGRKMQETQEIAPPKMDNVPIGTYDIKGDDSAPLIPPPPPSFSADYRNVTGTVKDVIIGDLVTLIIEDEEQREVKVVWLEHFIGEIDYIQDPKKLKNQKFIITYQSNERYMPKINEYISYNLLKRLSKVE